MSFNQAPRLPPNLDLLDGSVPVKRHSADPHGAPIIISPNVMQMKSKEILTLLATYVK